MPHRFLFLFFVVKSSKYSVEYAGNQNHFLYGLLTLSPFCHDSIFFDARFFYPNAMAWLYIVTEWPFLGMKSA